MNSKQKYSVDDYRMNLYTITTKTGFEWVAECPDFPNCVGQGITKIEAIAECESNLKTLIDFYIEEGKNLPIPDNSQEFEQYSGKFTVRLSKDLHKRASKLAYKNGISLNQYVIEAISEKTGKEESLNNELDLIMDYRSKLINSLNELEVKIPLDAKLYVISRSEKC